MLDHRLLLGTGVLCFWLLHVFSDAQRGIFYDVKTRQPIPMQTIGEESSTEGRSGLIHLGRSNGCTCMDYNCGCCAGVNITQFNFDREGCMNFTYDPYEFSISMNMLFNENSVYMNTISAKNPPPICMPIPVPYIPSVDFCVKMFNIFTPGRNLHMCMDMEMRLQRAAVFVLHFDCMRMGSDGIALVKPEENGGLAVTEAPARESTPSQEAADVFDPVTEIKF